MSLEHSEDDVLNYDRDVVSGFVEGSGTSDNEVFQSPFRKLIYFVQGGAVEIKWRRWQQIKSL